MSATKIQEPIFTGRRYEICAFAHGHDVVYYVEFGSYSGEWLLCSRNPANGEYWLWKGNFGSCSGCDNYEARMGLSLEWEGPTLSIAKDFVLGENGYKSFIEVPQTTMQNLVRNGTLEQIFPANIRDSSGDISWDEAVIDISASIKLIEGLPVEYEDILRVRNAEIKQKLIKAFGYEAFVQKANAQVINRDGPNELLRIRDGVREGQDEEIVFVYLQDSSTPRRYLLRVPPSMKTVREAVAWTFGMSVEEYVPLKET